MPPTDPRDSGPQCFECGYSLLGLTENRCPECGKEFNPTDWLPRHYTDLWISNPWNKRPGILSYCQTFLLSLFLPARLFKTYRGYYDDDWAVFFGMINWLVAAAAYVALLCTHRWSAAMGGSVVAVFALLGSGLFQSLAALLLDGGVRPRRGPYARGYWRPYTRYGTPFLVLSFCIAGLGVITLDRRNPVLNYSVATAWAGVTIWWLTGLGVTVTRGSRLGGMQVLAFFLILCTSAVASCAGYFWLVWGGTIALGL